MSSNNFVNASSSAQTNNDTLTAAERHAIIGDMFAMSGIQYNVFTAEFRDMIENKSTHARSLGMGSHATVLHANSKSSSNRLPTQDQIDAVGGTPQAWVKEVNEIRDILRTIALEYSRQSAHYKEVFWLAADL